MTTAAQVANLSGSDVELDDEEQPPKPKAPVTPQLSSADVEIEHPARSLTPKAPPAQTAVARANIAQYPENQQAPNPAYMQRKASWEAIQGEPAAPPFEEDPEQERRIRAQQTVQAGRSLIPQAAVPALQAVQTHVNEPLERMSRSGAEFGRDAALQSITSGAGEGNLPMDQAAREQRAQEFTQTNPRIAGTVRAAGSVIGGMVADPRMWPFFLAGPETAPALRAASGYGFAGQMAQGAYEQAGELGKIMDNPDVPQEDKWEAGANFVLSAIMAGHGAGSALAGEFQKLPAQDQAEITARIREKEPDVAAQIDQASKGQQTATPNLTAADVEIDNGKSSQPERFRLPKDTSAAEVQGPVKGPNIRTVQVGDKTYAFDQRKINADGVTSAVERGELWRLSGGKAPEAAKVQAETDLKGEEPTTQNLTANDVEKEEAAPAQGDVFDQVEPEPEQLEGTGEEEKFLRENEMTFQPGAEDMFEARQQLKQELQRRPTADEVIERGRKVTIQRLREQERRRASGEPEIIAPEEDDFDFRDFDPTKPGPNEPVTIEGVTPKGELSSGSGIDVVAQHGAQPERRTDVAQRKRVADLTPDERAKQLLTSEHVDLPNRRAFEEKEQDEKAPALSISDADGLKALNDTFGYEAGTALLQAKADALKEAGLDSYHDKGDEFLHRGHSEGDLRAKLDHAREILRNRVIEATLPDGTIKQFKGADFSYGTGSNLATAESGLKSHKSEREARGERARGELRGITEVTQGNENKSATEPAKEVIPPTKTEASGQGGLFSKKFERGSSTLFDRFRRFLSSQGDVGPEVERNQPVVRLSDDEAISLARTTQLARFANDGSFVRGSSLSGTQVERMANELSDMGQRDLSDKLRNAAQRAGVRGVILVQKGSPPHVEAEELFHGAQRELGKGGIVHLPADAMNRLLAHPVAEFAASDLASNGYDTSKPEVMVAEIAAKIATGDDFSDLDDAADWLNAYFQELHDYHGVTRVSNVAQTFPERAKEFYNEVLGQHAKQRFQAITATRSTEGGRRTEATSDDVVRDRAKEPPRGPSEGVAQNPAGEKAQDRLGQRGSSTPSAMPIPAIIEGAAGVIKKGSDLYHGAVDKLLDKVHMGNTRPEIRQFDPDAADLATKMDAGGQYHKAVAEMIGKKVSGPLSEDFSKSDTYSDRQKKNETSRDRMKGFHFLADAQNREWLKNNRPDDFNRWSNDPKIKAAIEAYKPFEEQLRQAVKQLGGKTINEDYIKRIMDFTTSGIAFEDKSKLPGQQIREGRAQARNGGGRDNVVSPQMDRSKGRIDEGQYYWDHGVFDFGPSFEKRWVEVMSKLDEHRLAVHAMSMGTRIAPDEESPDKVFYNGQEFYRPDVAREIREVQKRGVSAESKDLADALGVSELPAPGKVREYGNYEPLRRGSRFETAARNLAANVLSGKDDLAGQAQNLSNMAKLKYALPKEIVEALNDAGREKEQGAFSKMATKVLNPLTQFIRQQIVGLGYGIPHMANIMRKVVQSHTGAALNPMGWADAFKVAFSKELKARGISGTEDPMYNMLLKNAAMSEGAIPEYKHYIEGNFDKDNWKETFGNAFRKGGKAAGEVTPASAVAGVGRLAIEPLNRFSEAGHKNLFQSGGIDQRARIWMGDFLKDRYPKMSENGIANTVNQTLGRYNRASWTDVQKGLGPLMLFPGWDYSSMTYALKHPFKTAVAPALLMLMANSAVRSLGGNKKDEQHDLERLHVGKYSVRANILNDNMGTHLWGWALRGGKAVLDHKNAKDVTGEMVKGVPGDVAGVTTGTLNPILSTPIQVGANRVSPGRQDEITKPGDFHKKGKILPNKAAEDYADFGARRLFPLYDRATQAGQRPSVASFAGTAGVSVTEKKKKK